MAGSGLAGLLVVSEMWGNVKQYSDLHCLLLILALEIASLAERYGGKGRGTENHNTKSLSTSGKPPRKFLGCSYVL